MSTQQQQQMGGMDGMASLIKAQLLMKSDNIIFAFVVMTMFELLTGVLRSLFAMLKTYGSKMIEKRLKQKTQSLMNTIRQTTDEHTIQFERIYNKKGDWDMADAVLAHVLKIPAARNLLVVADLEVVVNQDRFCVDVGRVSRGWTAAAHLVEIVQPVSEAVLLLLRVGFHLLLHPLTNVNSCLCVGAQCKINLLQCPAIRLLEFAQLEVEVVLNIHTKPILVHHHLEICHHQ